MIILIMGVAGSGKTTIGLLLAEALNWRFSDADAFHSPENVEKMRQGIPLDEADRAPWLQSLRTAIEAWLHADENVVLACSALKNSYRQQLRINPDRIKLVYLTGTPELIQKRLQERPDHYMDATLLASQLSALEAPLDAIQIDIDQSPQAIVQKIGLALGFGSAQLS